MKIAFVIPWYGEEVKGGAEMELREVSVHLAAAGVDVEILTTCAKSFDSNWNVNYYAEGTAYVCGIPTRRFPVKSRDTQLFNKINRKLMRGENVNMREEKIFLNEMINSPSLYSYIEEKESLYDLFVFIPYMFGTTFFGVLSCPPNKSVMMPCLHDECYAHMFMFRQTYINIKGMIFNSRPEQELANRLYDLQETKQACIGIGMNTEIKSSPDDFRKKFGINKPFVIYAGRKDTGKNVDTLLKYFAEYKMRNIQSDLELVLIGGGEIEFPDGMDSYIHDLGYVDKADKYNAMAAAEFLCQPSKNESFSIVVMESWLCGRPVLVNEKCPVTANFVRQAQGGLYFKDYYEFEGCLKWFENNKKDASELGKMGCTFVKDHFEWRKITDKYIKFFKELTEE